MPLMLGALLFIAVIAIAMYWRQLKNPHALARTGRIDRLRHVIQGSPELLNAPGKGGETPQQGADRALKDAAGRTAAEVAAVRGPGDAAAVIREGGHARLR